jgi:di/tricarboxylate transporter
MKKAGRAPVALLIVVAMVVSAAMNWLPLVTAAFTAALAVIVTRCLRGREAQTAVDIKVLVVIAAALGLGQAVENVGLSSLLAGTIVETLLPFGTIAVMIGLYVCTNVLTELITHKAAAVLMIPVALAAAGDAGADPKAFALVVAVGAAASFITPIGYQTNLMVMSAGGYRYRDFFRVGLPVSLLVMTIAVTMIYLVWITG